MYSLNLTTVDVKLEPTAAQRGPVSTDGVRVIDGGANTPGRWRLATRPGGIWASQEINCETSVTKHHTVLSLLQLFSNDLCIVKKKEMLGKV